MPRITIIHAHPDQASFGRALSEAYAQAARTAGHEVRDIRLADLAFDPILHHGYREIQPLEPDLIRAQEDIKWAEHLVFQYPTWWGSPPALLKGFLDRAFLPGWAFKYRDRGSFWDKLLAGRSARLIVTMDAPGFYDRLAYRASSRRAMSHAVLRFCGVKPVRVTTLSSVKASTPAKREAWLHRVRALGTQAR